ncbi:MAG: tetratricopeptide repeat protein [Chitinophagaceae bacterium]|nr:tetratricopeptide repeat protein [Chitinophagaceae bacterium]
MQLKKVIALYLLTAFLFSCTNEGSKPNTPASDTPGTSVTEQLLQDSSTADTVREQLIEQLVQKNQYNKALEQIDRLLAKDSSNPGWLYMKADALERSGDTSGAINYYNKAVNKAGIFIEAEMRAANLFAETGNKNALVLCDNLLKNAGATRFRSDILMMKGIYYSKIQNSVKALEVFNQVIREDYSYMDAYIEKGLVYYDQKKYADAWKVFNKSTEVSNTFADGYFWMAKAEEKMNQKEEAIANYKRSLVLDQSFSEAREALQRLGVIK